MVNKEIPITKIHSYNVSVAVDVGINAAIIFYNICFWVEQNYANERNFINGEYWTYNTVNAFKTMFPEMSYEQVRNALRKLEEKGYIKSAFLSDDSMNRTKYYAVCDFDKWIAKNKCKCENSQMDCEQTQMECGNDTHVNNIYNNINTDSDKKQTDNKPTDNSQANSKAHSFFTKKVRERKRTVNQDELLNRIHNVVSDLNTDILSDDLAENVEQCLTYFVEQYAEVFGKRHPVLQERTLYDLIADLIEDTYEDRGEFETHFYPLVSDEPEDNSYESVIDLYFETEFKENIDYSMVHFSQKNVLTKLMGHDASHEWFRNES